MRENLIKEKLYAVPFVPFTMQLTDGRRLPVRHPELMSIGRHSINLVSLDEDLFLIIDPMLVISLEFTNGSKLGLPPRYRTPREDDDFTPGEGGS